MGFLLCVLCVDAYGSRTTSGRTSQVTCLRPAPSRNVQESDVEVVRFDFRRTNGKFQSCQTEVWILLVPFPMLNTCFHFLKRHGFKCFCIWYFWGWGRAVCAVLIRQKLIIFNGMTILKTKVVFCHYKRLEWFRSLGLQAVRKINLVENMELFATICSSV